MLSVLVNRQLKLGGKCQLVKLAKKVTQSFLPYIWTIKTEANFSKQIAEDCQVNKLFCAARDIFMDILSTRRT